MDKPGLIESFRNSRIEWEVLLKQVGKERMTTPGVTGDWSVKDVVAHQTAWEQRPLAWLTAKRPRRNRHESRRFDIAVCCCHAIGFQK